MHDLISLIQQYGLTVVFTTVLIEGIGLPLPSYAVVLIAAGLAKGLDHGPLDVMLVAFVAGLVGDLVRYRAGLRYGYRLLGLLCRVSISPNSCVQKTESIFFRWGPSSLLVSRFIPGFSVIAQPLAGALKQPVRSFLAYDSLGTLIWCGSAVALGVIFSAAVDDVLNALSRYGLWGLSILLGAFVVFLACKWFQRHRFIRSLRMDRITVDELRSLILQGGAPVILDVRPSEIQSRDGVIPGSLTVVYHTIDSLALPLDSTAEIVVYCACPNEASAATLAKLLLRKGAKRVRPLLGGIDAWVAAGFDLAMQSDASPTAHAQTSVQKSQD